MKITKVLSLAAVLAPTFYNIIALLAVATFPATYGNARLGKNPDLTASISPTTAGRAGLRRTGLETSRMTITPETAQQLHAASSVTHPTGRPCSSDLQLEAREKLTLKEWLQKLEQMYPGWPLEEKIEWINRVISEWKSKLKPEDRPEFKKQKHKVLRYLEDQQQLQQAASSRQRGPQLVAVDQSLFYRCCHPSTPIYGAYTTYGKR